VTIFGPPRQLAYLVDDLASAVARWVSHHGAGPFFVREHIPTTDVVIRGSAASFDHSSAYGQWGDLMVELVVIHGAERERLLPAGGLHHIAVFVDDLAAALVDRDDVALIATAGATRFAFIDAVSTTGHYWELYEPSERLLGFYDMVRSASRGWSGDEAFRLIG
jgi:Glyoxalase/Bleomycin resistance protein/Dioxygenase superfamily